MAGDSHPRRGSRPAAPPLLGDYLEAQFVVRVRARAVYPNGPRYIHRYSLVRPSRFVPHSEGWTPVPEWKRSDWAADVLPEHDPARDPADRDVLPAHDPARDPADRDVLGRG
jgi:hypothetical protein